MNAKIAVTVVSFASNRGRRKLAMKINRMRYKTSTSQLRQIVVLLLISIIILLECQQLFGRELQYRKAEAVLCSTTSFAKDDGNFSILANNTKIIRRSIQQEEQQQQYSNSLRTEVINDSSDDKRHSNRLASKPKYKIRYRPSVRAMATTSSSSLTSTSLSIKGLTNEEESQKQRSSLERYKGRRRKQQHRQHQQHPAPALRIKSKMNKFTTATTKRSITTTTTSSSSSSSSGSSSKPLNLKTFTFNTVPRMFQKQQQFSYNQHPYMWQQQSQQQTIQIPSLLPTFTITNTTGIPSITHNNQLQNNFGNSLPTSTLYHYYTAGTTKNFSQQSNIKYHQAVIPATGDVLLYRNIDAVPPCPPNGVRLITTHGIPLVPNTRRPVHRSHRECQCNLIGSVSNTCDRISGQCQCLANVTGRRCDKCKAGHWNLTENTGCHDCRCNPAGSRSNECNPWTGQCDCKIGVGGQHCNECTDGFYGFSLEGCQRCPGCAREGQVCDPLNGRCVCPSNTKGLGCTQCMEGTWGWMPRLGCQHCHCDRSGAIGQSCELATGQCQCREGYTGRRCDSCSIGYYGYPKCRRCMCNIEGSVLRNDGLIACDSQGQCPCKSLVTGSKCDSCQKSTFGLSLHNPEGCTKCYCFGRSTDCMQSNWSWGHVRMTTARNLTANYLHSPVGNHREIEYIYVEQMLGNTYIREVASLENLNGLTLIPHSMGNITMGRYTRMHFPLYFQLPTQFLGDHTTSYGGNLYFKLLTIGGQTPLERQITIEYPLIQIHAYEKLILNFYEYEGLEYVRNVSYKVPISEKYWRLNHNGQIVDRSTLMVALQNVQHILVRGACFADFSEVILLNVHMDTAIYINGSTSMIAKGVEQCKCPQRYEGLSCQNAGEGYYRLRNRTGTQIVYVEDLLGEVVACQCNGRSSNCNRETGECLNCTNNTGGWYCDQCAEGFYGDPNSLYGCQACPCPETNRNFARGCTVDMGEISCICRPGYTGRLCERCQSGYISNATDLMNSKCLSCNCNVYGSREEGCDSESGQCFCKEGVTGLYCNKCRKDRHYLDVGGCKLCDNCTLLLMDYVDLIGHKLRRAVHHVDLSSIPAPYIKVEEYNTHYNELSERFKEFKRLAEALLAYDNTDRHDLEIQTELQMQKCQKLSTKAAKYTLLSDALLREAVVLHIDLTALKADILENIRNLDDYGKEDIHMTLPSALHQAKFYLESIKHDNALLPFNIYDDSCAWKYFNRYGNISNLLETQTGKVSNIRKDLNETMLKVTDLYHYINRTIEMQNNLQNALDYIQNVKSSLIEDYNNVQDMNNKLNHNFSQDTKSNALENFETQQQQLIAVKDLLSNLRMTFNASLNTNGDIYREVRKHWLPKAEKHASRLLERSNEYARQFQPTKHGARIAMLASSAHKNISTAIEQARTEASEATKKVHHALNKLYPKSIGNISIIERSENSLEKSFLLKNNAKLKLNDTKNLQLALKQNEDKVESIQKRLHEADLQANSTIEQLHQLKNGRTHKEAAKSLAVAEDTSQQMLKLSNQTKRIHSNLQQMRKSFAFLDKDWEHKLNQAEENISLTSTNIRLSNITMTYIEEQGYKQDAIFEEWNQTMAHQLQHARDLIAKAKHAADSIKISMESGEKACRRSYLPTSYGLSTSNTIKLTFALPKRINDSSALLYLQGRDGRYIAVDLFRKHIRLIWNLGGATAIIVHPLEIQSRNPKYDDAWYHVEANRTLNVGHLLVRRMNNFGSLTPQVAVSGYSDISFTRFFQTTEEHIYLGGYPKIMRNKDVQLASGLNAVLYNVEIDNRPLGIWNFISSEGDCQGAMKGAQESSASSLTRHFNGLGYAEVRKLRPRPYRRNMFALQMTFKTLDENALLFLAVDDKNNRSVSVTLNRGHVIFRIDYGEESKLEINTTHKYNTGNWIKIEAAREFVPKRGTENGMLRVNTERPITGSPTVPIKSHMLPDLSASIYYLGGVPPGFSSGSSKAPGADNPFLGCMMDVQVNGETYDPLESSSFYGVEPACKEVITKAGFSGHGYIELPSQSLRKRANVAMVFRTLQSHCLLMLSAYPPDVIADYDDKDVKGNYSMTLVEGHLQVWINSGRSRIQLASNVSLNDGEFHVVSILKTGRRFELIVDDELQDVKSLLSSPTVISLPRDAGGLYIGGAPNYDIYKELAPTLLNLEGAIRDVVFNNQTTNFKQALRFANVQIGRNGPTMGSTSGLSDILLKTEPMIGKSFTATPVGCKRVGSYSYEPNAYKFGDVPHSYAQLRAPTRNYWHRNFHISFDFRSFYPNGLILLAAGHKDKQKHYVALLLKDGHLVLIIRGRRREELPLHAKLNDGEWHHVSIQCLERKVTMSVEIGRTDQKTSAQMKIPKRIAASPIIYVGDLPENPPKIPPELMMKIEPFKGCIRKFILGNVTEDLARPGKHRNIGQCFPNVERGSYFPGDAYAVYKKNFQVGKYLEMELEFRTSELSGILLSIAEPNGFPAMSLELYNGNIAFSCDLGDGIPFRIESKLPHKYSLCDNKWHNISALYDDERIALRVDQMPPIMSVAPQRVERKIQTKSPLYIGGIPDVASSGTLLTRENFKGCIRNISIRNERRDWIDMDSLHNVLLTECLVTGESS